MAPIKLPNASRGTIRGASIHGILNFTIRASPLPQVILEFILENIVTIKKLQVDQQDHSQDEDEEGVDMYGDIVRKPTVKPAQFWDALRLKCGEAGGEWEGIVDKIWAFGPQKAGGCLLIDARKPSPLSS